MPLYTATPSSFGDGAFVSVEKTGDAFAPPGKVAYFHRFPASKFHLIHHFHCTGHAADVLHGETSIATPDPFDLAPLNRR
jgi:hypothetical protein